MNAKIYAAREVKHVEYKVLSLNKKEGTITEIIIVRNRDIKIKKASLELF